MDENRILKYCRNGAHLENCEKFNCSYTYKCPGSYCIPYHMICNGVADCSNMEDEQSCDTYICPGMLRCKGKTYCVPRHEVCDGILHCQQGDDEINCETCPTQCECNNHALFCEQMDVGKVLLFNISGMKKMCLSSKCTAFFCVKTYHNPSHLLHESSELCHHKA